MKTVSEWLELKTALERDYETILNSDIQYDPATVAYAKKCMEDAQKSHQKALADEALTEVVTITEEIEVDYKKWVDETFSGDLWEKAKADLLSTGKTDVVLENGQLIVKEEIA